MALPSYPLINGKRFDHSSIVLTVLGKPYLGVRELNYSMELTPGEVYGTSAQKLGRTRGQAKPDGSLTVYREDFGDLITLLQASRGATMGFMEVEFLVNVTYQEGIFIQSDSLVGCRIKKVDMNSSQGSDALLVKCDLDIMDIKFFPGASSVPIPPFIAIK